MRSSSNGGIVLIFVGMFFLLSRINLLPRGVSLLAFIGVGFFVFYLRAGGRAYYKNIGLLIPACILTMVGVEEWINMLWTGRISSQVFLGTAFLGIYLLHTVHFKELNFGQRNWPLFPSVALYLSGFKNILPTRLAANFWPILLIGMGIMMVLQNQKASPKNSQAQQEEVIDMRKQQ